MTFPQTPPRAVVFDLLGTIFPLGPLRDAMVEFGLPPAALDAWLDAAQRDRLGLALTGEVRPFYEVMDGALDGILAAHGVYEPAGARAELMQRLIGLAPHPQAAEALGLLRRANIAAIALSKGAAADVAPAIHDVGMGGNIVSIHDFGQARSQSGIFHEVARAAGVVPAEVAMVTAYPWVVNAAAATGMRTAWLASGRRYPAAMRRPDVHAEALPAAIRALIDPGQSPRLAAAS